MTDLLSALRTLLIMLIGFAVMVGLLSPGRACKMILRMLLLPVVLILLGCLVADVWHTLSPWQRSAVIVGGPPLVLGLGLFSTRFGREVLASMLGNFLYDVLRWGVRRLHWILLALAAMAGFLWLL